MTTTSSLPLSIVAIVALLGACDTASALSLRINTRYHHATSARAPTIHRSTNPRAQFGGNQDTEPKGLTRDNEPEEFFSTNMGAPPHLKGAARYQNHHHHHHHAPPPPPRRRTPPNELTRPRKPRR